MELKEGIVVKSINYQDNSKIIYLITEHGKDSLILKNATNLKSHTFSYSQELTKIGYSKSKNYFSSGKVINGYTNIKSDHGKLESGLKVVEIANVLIEHIEDSCLFYQFFDHILTLINNETDHHKYEIIYRIKTLYLLGVSPNFTRCVSCDTRNNLMGFSFYSGGMKCNQCMSNDDFVYNNNCIELLKTLYLTKLESIKTLDIDYKYQHLDTFLSLYYEHFLGFTSKVENVFQLLSKKK